MRPIVLIGFPGTGKSTVGRLLAARLGRAFVDLDDLVVEAAGRSIPDIFRSDGEPAFRQLEREALERALTQEAAVIATGGGAPCREPNISIMLAAGTVVALAASVEEVLRRTGRRSGRPLLDGEDPLPAARKLLAARLPFYARAHHTVQTEAKSPADIADEITKLLERKES